MRIFVFLNRLGEKALFYVYFVIIRISRQVTGRAPVDQCESAFVALSAVTVKEEGRNKGLKDRRGQELTKLPVSPEVTSVEADLKAFLCLHLP